jgi:sulfide dehydrogenase cytochrome subunit
VKTRYSTTILLGICLTACSAPLIADEPIASAAMLAGTCAGCHGTDGASPGPIAPIKGYSASSLATAMRMFRSGQRPSTEMQRIAKGYNDAEIEAMASYFAAQR